MNKARILIVDDDEVARKNLTRLFQKEGFIVSGAKTGAEALVRLARKPYDLVLTDLVMDDIDGLEVLTKTKEQFPDLEVILITGYASIPSAIEATKKGAFYYLEKPFRPDEVKHLARQAIEKKLLRERVKDLEAQVKGRSKEPVLIGQSREMLEVVKLLKQVAQADCNVLLTGESGTGKELAATLIHYYSRRAEGKFLAINCGGFTEELLANELFGHEKEAFTGAATSRDGLLKTASGGTLLLDEIGDMPLSMQVKLLRAVQEHEVIRVGDNQPIPIDIRIIAATNQDLRKAVSAGIFRQDLYYRLNVISIRIPPLRERKKDIPILAHFFLNRATKRSGKDITDFSEQAMKVLIDYDYPGNVRELENIVEHGVAMALEDIIQVRDLPPDLSKMDIFSFDRPDSRIKPLEEVQRDYIQWVLKQVGRNKTKAAKLLGIDRTSMWRHLKRHEIKE
ncbi:MAG: Fis family transcriptional regulator [Deltaproteobacteria bacterium CG1_02_45_11]|nr:MAG: Fis family transcriptional regulator [Deltaproteobacteria bacterium CG1_02_45_11]